MLMLHSDQCPLRLVDLFENKTNCFELTEPRQWGEGGFVLSSIHNTVFPRQIIHMHVQR